MTRPVNSRSVSQQGRVSTEPPAVFAKSVSAAPGGEAHVLDVAEVDPSCEQPSFSSRLEQAVLELLAKVSPGTLEALHVQGTPPWKYEPGPSGLAKLAGVFEHYGVKLSALPSKEGNAVRKLFEEALSKEGFDVSESVDVQELNRGADHTFLQRRFFKNDPDNYRLLVMKNPGTGKPWAVRWEGHHRSITLNVDPNKRTVSAAPAFLGSTSDDVTLKDGRRVQPFARLVETMGAFGASLEAEGDAGKIERARQSLPNGQPMFSQMSPNLWGKTKTLEQIRTGGLSVRELNPPQRNALEAAIEAFLSHYSPDLAAGMRARMGEMENWTLVAAGDLRVNGQFYYRVQGERFMFEFMSSEWTANHRHIAYIEE